MSPSEEDRKWRESVETRLVSLTAAQKQTDDELDKIENLLDEMEEILEGDPLKRQDAGLKGDVRELDKGLNELRAIMAPDALGKGGIKKRLEACEETLGLRERRSDNRWAFGRVVATATVGVIGTIIVALLSIPPIRDAVGHWFESHYSSQKSKKPAPRKSSKKPRRAPPPTPAAEGIPDGPPASGEQ